MKTTVHFQVQLELQDIALRTAEESNEKDFIVSQHGQVVLWSDS